MHLAVFAEERSVSIKNRAGIVIDAGGAALEKRNDQRDFLSFGEFGKFFRRRAGHRFRKIEKLGIFGAAKVFAEKQFVERNNLRAARRCLADFLDGARQIFFRVRRAFHLHQANGKFVCHNF